MSHKENLLSAIKESELEYVSNSKSLLENESVCVESQNFTSVTKDSLSKQGTFRDLVHNKHTAVAFFTKKIPAFTVGVALAFVSLGQVGGSSDAFVLPSLREVIHIQLAHADIPFSAPVGNGGGNPGSNGPGPTLGGGGNGGGGNPGGGGGGNPGGGGGNPGGGGNGGGSTPGSQPSAGTSQASSNNKSTATNKSGVTVSKCPNGAMTVTNNRTGLSSRIGPDGQVTTSGRNVTGREGSTGNQGGNNSPSQRGSTGSSNSSGSGSKAGAGSSASGGASLGGSKSTGSSKSSSSGSKTSSGSKAGAGSSASGGASLGGSKSTGSKGSPSSSSKSSSSGKSTGGSACFTANEHVLTTEGVVAIVDIKEGMKVISYDEDSDMMTTSVVGSIIMHTQNNDPHDFKMYPLLKIEVIVDDQEVTTQVTANHRYFNPSTKSYRPIGEFVVGDTLKTESGQGRIASIEAILGGETFEEDQYVDVYNLHMSEGPANYLVNGVVVHNAK